jgi:phosphoribosylformylglycinamidine cyclo-ligase
MGHRMELYVNKEHAQEIINISKQFGVNAKIIGKVEKYQGKKLTIKSQHGEFVY